jgi:hypothetical protein
MPLEATMSVANRYKVLTLSGSQCFALLRSMNTREAWLVSQITAGKALDEEDTFTDYLQSQLDALRATRDTFSSTPFQEGAKS